MPASPSTPIDAEKQETYVQEEMQEARSERGRWGKKVLDFFVIDQLHRVRQEDQRKAWRWYVVLLCLYLLGIVYLTLHTFRRRDNPPVSMQLNDHPDWTTTPPPNMVVCFDNNHLNPTWLLAGHISQTDKERTDTTDRVRIMDCNSKCLWVVVSREDPGINPALPTETIITKLRVGFTFSDMDINSLAENVHFIVFFHSPSIQTPEGICLKKSKQEDRHLLGSTIIPAYPFGFRPSMASNSSKRLVWPYTKLVLERTRRDYLHPNKYNKLAAHQATNYTYTTRVAPLQAVGARYGDSWTMPLMNDTEAAALRERCFPDLPLQQCPDWRDEIRDRLAQLKQAGDKGFYLELELWRSERELVMTQTDPVSILELMSQWSGAWGWVTFGFCLLLFKTYFDTYETYPCFRKSFWGCKSKNEDKKSEREEEFKDSGADEEGRADAGPRRRQLKDRLKNISLPPAPRVNVPQPDLGSVYLDLKGMREWYLQCMEQQKTLPPKPRAEHEREVPSVERPSEESMSQEDVEEKAEVGRG